MKDFWSMYQSEIVSAIISFLVALFTSLFVHLLSNFKLRYSEKLKIASELSRMKFEGITKIREEINILSQYEDLSITESKNHIVNEKIYTPACCYSYEKLLKIASILNDLHGKYGHCLRHKSVIYLIYIKSFFQDYALKCMELRIPNEDLRFISIPLYGGIHKWYKKFDKELINSLNSVSMKYFAHSGFQYSLLLKVYGWYFNRNAPYRYMNDKNNGLKAQWISLRSSYNNHSNTELF